MARIGSRDEWRAARLDLLSREKELTRLRDELAAERRRLPWVRLDKRYEFDGASGRVPMRDLFDGHGQLVVYHFMLGPGWGEGCPLCSFWADSFNATHPVRRAPGSKQLTTLQEAGYVEIRKAFIGKRPRTSARLSKAGRAAFEMHVAALQQIIDRSGAPLR